MKKLFLTLCLLSSVFCTNAQRDYVYIKAHNSSKNTLKNLGGTLNDYLSKGYYVEKMSATIASGTKYVSVIMSNNNQGVDIESYLFIENRGSQYILSGDIPSGVKTTIDMERRDMAELLNTLSNNGFVVAFFDIEYDYEFYILSKNRSGSNSSLRSVTTENQALKEMARYNLKGMPVSNSYKGLQIIVYSDYSTKIIKNK